MSSADRIGSAGHGQLIGTPLTLAIVAAKGGGHLAVPVRRPFTLGTLRLELIPSGRGLGAAALHVNLGERTVLYSGAVRTTDSNEPAEVRASDAVIVAAPFGELHHRFPRLSHVTAAVITWARARLAAGEWPVLVVDTAFDGLEVAARLAAAGMVVAGSRSVRTAAQHVAALDSEIPAIRAPGKEPCVVIRAAADRIKVGKAAVALVSGRALDPHPDYAVAFAWPFAAGRDELLAWIDQTRAKEIFVTGACAETIVAAVGPRARVLGPPHQMTLFPREVAK